LVEELEVHISTTTLLKEEKDVQVWRNEEAGCFCVNSAYECLSKHGRGPQFDVFKLLWEVKVFPSVVTVAWRMLMDRLPTRECLSRRGVLME